MAMMGQQNRNLQTAIYPNMASGNPFQTPQPAGSPGAQMLPAMPQQGVVASKPIAGQSQQSQQSQQPASLGNGWDQFNSDPFVNGLQTALGRGLKGDAAIQWMNDNGWQGAVNPSGGGIQYYANTDSFGLPGGHKVNPNGNGGYDIYMSQGSGKQSPQMPMMNSIGMTNAGLSGINGDPSMGGQPSAGDNGSQQALAQLLQALMGRNNMYTQSQGQ